MRLFCSSEAINSPQIHPQPVIGLLNYNFVSVIPLFLFLNQDFPFVNLFSINPVSTFVTTDNAFKLLIEFIILYI